MSLSIKNLPLRPGEFFTGKFVKDKIFIHHTAGGHNPENVIHGWNTDRTPKGETRQVATSFIIGGLSTRNGDGTFDGKIYRCFNEDLWAAHLGLDSATLDRTSIGIELCNYGWVRKSANGKFYSYVNSEVPANMVHAFAKPFRNERYYHRYTDAQIDALGELLLYLKSKFAIDIKKGLKEWIAREALTLPPGLSLLDKQKWLRDNGFTGRDGQKIRADGVTGANTEWALKSIGQSAFEYNYQCLNDSPGLWTHTNVRLDKTDCSPQSHLIEMIKGL